MGVREALEKLIHSQDRRVKMTEIRIAPAEYDELIEECAPQTPEEALGIKVIRATELAERDDKPTVH